MCALESQGNRIILAITDFSKKSTNAILFAGNILKYTNLKLGLLNVFENPSDYGNLLISVEDIIAKDSEAGLKKQSEEIASVLKRKNLTVSTYSMPGKLKKAINSIAQSENIDLLLLGVSADKYPLKNIPLLFIGQNKQPILLVPENCSAKSVKSVLTITLNEVSHLNTKKSFEHIINHDHISNHYISINKKLIDGAKAGLIYDTIEKQKAEMVIIVPSPGDAIDRALSDFQIQDLSPIFSRLLNG